MCLLRGTNWVFKPSSLRLAFKGIYSHSFYSYMFLKDTEFNIRRRSLRSICGCLYTSYKRCVAAKTSQFVCTISNYFFKLLKPTGHVMHQQFNIQQLYVLPTLYLCVLYLSENKQRLVPLTA